MKYLMLFCSAALVLFAAAGPVAAQPKPYTIDAILSLTGPAATLGQAEAAALGAFEKLANRQGGIHGTPIHFEVSDDTSNPATAVQLANAILAKHPAVGMR